MIMFTTSYQLISAISEISDLENSVFVSETSWTKTLDGFFNPNRVWNLEIKKEDMYLQLEIMTGQN